MAKQLKITAFFNSPGAPLSKPETMTRLDSSDDEEEDPTKIRRKPTTKAKSSPPKKPVAAKVPQVVTMSDSEDSDTVQKSRAKETPKITARPSVIKRTPKRKRQSSESANSESSSDISVSKGQFILLSSDDESSSPKECSPDKFSSQPTNVQDGIIGMKVRSPNNRT